MKRIAYILALLCLTVGVILAFASCSDSESGGDSSSQATTDSKEPTSDSSQADGSVVNSSTGDSSNTGDPSVDSSTTDNSTTDSSTTDSSTTDSSTTDSSTTDSSTTDSSTTDSSTTDSSTTDSSTTDSSTPNSGNDDDVVIIYTVRVVDAFGNTPEQSVIVEMFKDGESLGEAAMRRGAAAFRLAPGEYTFEVKPMEGEFYYDKSLCVFDEETTEKTVVVYDYAKEDSKQQIWIYDENAMDHIPYDAVSVEEGATYVTIDRAAGSYFIFTPTRGGIYRISYESPRNVTFGYYGSPHNVLTNCPLDVVDGAFEIEIKNEGVNIGNPGGTTQIVIGIRSFAVKGCVLKIERIGNPTVELPWTDVQANKNAIKVDTYVNSEFVDFDITNKDLTVVFNEKDGYYHLNTVDGPTIYVRISSALIESSTSEETIYAYLPSFIAMCDTDRLGKVFYDDEGNIVLKESYNEMFKQYAILAGTNGMYPLNEQLASAIKNIGDHKSWFDFENDFHIFGDKAPMVVKENAWLFACAYESQKAFGTNEKPVPLTPDKEDSAKTYAVLLDKDAEVTLRTISKATITLANADGIKIVANDGTEYVADSETGILSAVINANQNFTIVYEGEEDSIVARFTFIVAI